MSKRQRKKQKVQVQRNCGTTPRLHSSTFNETRGFWYYGKLTLKILTFLVTESGVCYASFNWGRIYEENIQRERVIDTKEMYLNSATNDKLKILELKEQVYEYKTNQSKPQQNEKKTK